MAFNVLESFQNEIKLVRKSTSCPGRDNPPLEKIACLGHTSFSWAMRPGSGCIGLPGGFPGGMTPFPGLAFNFNSTAP